MDRNSFQEIIGSAAECGLSVQLLKSYEDERIKGFWFAYFQEVERQKRDRRYHNPLSNSMVYPNVPGVDTSYMGKPTNSSILRYSSPVSTDPFQLGFNQVRSNVPIVDSGINRQQFWEIPPYHLQWPKNGDPRKIPSLSLKHWNPHICNSSLHHSSERYLGQHKLHSIISKPMPAQGNTFRNCVLLNQQVKIVTSSNQQSAGVKYILPQTISWYSHTMPNSNLCQNVLDVGRPPLPATKRQHIEVSIQRHQPKIKDMIPSLPPQEQKELLGESLFPMIEKLYPAIAGKITGMLLEIDNSELIHMLEHPECLEPEVNRAAAILRDYEFKCNQTKKID